MTLRIILAVGLTLAVGLAATAAWRQLSDRADQQFIAQAEAHSYAARSELVRDLQVQMQDLHDIARYWDKFGHLARDEWGGEDKVDLEHFGGIELLLWHDAERGVRFIGDPRDFRFDARPSETQWQRHRWLLNGIDPQRGTALLGPVDDGDGEYSYRAQVLVDKPVSGGVLIALIDADRALDALLRDTSPGYAISVYWDEALLYRRGEPAPVLADEWRREGLIRLPSGDLWRVVHEPTPELVAARSEPALSGLLATGWAVAILLGLLLYLNGHVRQRAQDAEAAERRIAALNAELEAQVEQRTRELAERTRDLETISESVVHDLRNPLNAIAVNAQLLRHAGEGEESSADRVTLLGRIDHALQQSAAILERMHAFSSVSFAPFQREMIDMTTMVREVFADVAEAEPAPQVELELGELPPCRADPTMVRILLLNLLSNACKYSRDRDARRVTVSAASADDGTVYTVSDNGVGFNPTEAEALFEPFVRFAGRADVDGRGVGLAVVARIVRRHGGRIWAEGRPDVGASFSFHLNDGRIAGAGSQQDAA